MVTKRHVLAGSCILVCLLLAAAVIGWVKPGSSQAPERNPGASFDLFTGNTAVVGDANADGSLSESEKSDLEVTKATSTLVFDKIAAKRGVNTVVVTPSGGLWWRFISGLSTQTGSWDAPAPERAYWFAYTEGRAYNPGTGTKRPYDALHIAFHSEEDALNWVEKNAAHGTGGNTNNLFRGGMLTLTPSWVSPQDEPFRDIDDLELGDHEVRIGMWQVDFDEQVSLRADESVLPADYKKVFENLGMGGRDVSWVATSAAPNAIWRGTIDGFEPSKISVENAVGLLNVSYANCDKSRKGTCANGQGLAEAVNYTYISTSPDKYGGDLTWKPEHAPADYDLVFVMGKGWRGATSGTFAFDQSPVESISMWITNKKILAIQPVVLG